MSSVRDNFPITPEEFERAENNDVIVIPRLMLRVRQLAQQNLRFRLIDAIRLYAQTTPTSYTSYALWHAIQTGPKSMPVIVTTELDALAYEAGVWCLFDDVDPDDDCKFIPLHEWEPMYETWKVTTAQ